MANSEKTTTYKVLSLNTETGFATVLFINPWNDGPEDPVNKHVEQMVPYTKQHEIEPGRWEMTLRRSADNYHKLFEVRFNKNKREVVRDHTSAIASCSNENDKALYSGPNAQKNRHAIRNAKAPGMGAKLFIKTPAKKVSKQ